MNQIRTVGRWLNQPMSRHGKITFGVAVALVLSCQGADTGSGKGRPPNKGDKPKGNCSVSFPTRAPRISPTSVKGAASVYCQKPYPTTHAFFIELQISTGGRFSTVATDSSSKTPSPGPIRLDVDGPCEAGDWRIHAEIDGIAANGFDIKWSGYSNTATVTEGTCHDLLDSLAGTPSPPALQVRQPPHRWRRVGRPVLEGTQGLLVPRDRPRRADLPPQ